jgi:hypothetical protein
MSFDIDPSSTHLERGDANVARPAASTSACSRGSSARPGRCRPVPVPRLMPWWVRAAGERHVALAFLIAGSSSSRPRGGCPRDGPAAPASVSIARPRVLAPWLTPLAQASRAAHELALALACASFLCGARTTCARARAPTTRAAFRLRA